MRRTQFAAGEYYHIYNRGVDKRKVFTTLAEYRRFLAYLYYINDAERIRLTDTLRHNLEAKPREAGWKPLVAIGAYCLMPNHFHLYVTPMARGGVSKFMQRLQTAYTMYFNEKHRRVGALFQGTFKAEHVARDQYAKYLFSYIHLNPAKIKNSHWKRFGARDFKRVREFVRAYPYSSFGEYDTKEYSIVDPSQFPTYLQKRSDIDSHINEWLAASPLEAKPREVAA